MTPFHILAGILVVFLGITFGRTCKTMTTGPREGTRLGGLIVAGGIGLVVGVAVAGFVPGMWFSVLYSVFGAAVLYWLTWTIAEKV